jgi:hypothetical protein
MNKLKFLGLFAFIAILSTSCSDDDENNVTQPQTIADIAIAGEDFSILETALTRTDLVATLDGTTQFTVFAPTNDAFNTFFASLGANVNVNNVDVNVLKAILKGIVKSLLPFKPIFSSISPDSEKTTSNIVFINSNLTILIFCSVSPVFVCWIDIKSSIF